MREDRDRGKLTIAASFARTLSGLGIEPEPDLVADLSRRDVELSPAFTRLCADTVPFLEWLRSNGVLTALVSNCDDTTRAAARPTWGSSRWSTRWSCPARSAR